MHRFLSAGMVAWFSSPPPMHWPGVASLSRNGEAHSRSETTTLPHPNSDVRKQPDTHEPPSCRLLPTFLHWPHLCPRLLTCPTLLPVGATGRPKPILPLRTLDLQHLARHVGPVRCYPMGDVFADEKLRKSFQF